jgi:3-hydroxy-D-aspartate aldolase
MGADYGRDRDGDEPPGRGPRHRRRGPHGASDSGPPLVCDAPAATNERASDEHGRLAVAAATNRLGLGGEIRLIPGHCDPTVNLYVRYVCVRGNRVEQLWPITALGAMY